MAKEKANASSPTPAPSMATLHNHERVVDVHAKRLQALAEARRPRKRAGLNPDDIDRAVVLLRDDVPWEKLKAKFPDIADEALEGWRERLEDQARYGKQRRMPTPPAKG